MCGGVRIASFGVKALYQVSAVVVLPWHWPQLPAIPVCKTEFAAKVAVV